MVGANLHASPISFLGALLGRNRISICKHDAIQTGKECGWDVFQERLYRPDKIRHRAERFEFVLTLVRMISSTHCSSVTDSSPDFLQTARDLGAAVYSI